MSFWVSAESNLVNKFDKAQLKLDSFCLMLRLEKCQKSVLFFDKGINICAALSDGSISCITRARYSQRSVLPFLLSLHNWFCPLFYFFWYTYWKEEMQRGYFFKAKWNSAVFSFLCFLVFSQCPSLSELLAQQTSLASFSSPLCMGSPDCGSMDTPIKSYSGVICIWL